MSALPPGVFQLLPYASGTTGAVTVGIFNQVVEDFGFDTYGNGVGFLIRIEGSNDESDWFPLTYISATGYATLLHNPCAYVRAVVITPPTSGTVTCVVAGK